MALLTANGDDASKTAKETGIPCTTLLAWASGERRPPVTQLCHEKKREFLDTYERHP